MFFFIGFQKNFTTKKTRMIVESNFITPLVEKKTVKTHPILGIFFLSLFSEILGIFGMIIAIPVLSLIQITLKFKKTK